MTNIYFAPISMGKTAKKSMRFQIGNLIKEQNNTKKEKKGQGTSIMKISNKIVQVEVDGDRFVLAHFSGLS